MLILERLSSLPITSIISVAPPGVIARPDTAILRHHITAPVLIPSFSERGRRLENKVSLSNEVREERISFASLSTVFTVSNSDILFCLNKLQK